MRNLASFLSALLLASVGAQAQPSPAPESGDAPCGNPPSASLEPDRSHADADGFSPLFNGADFSGWWLNCRTAYSAGDTLHGPIFRVDRERSALYTNQRGVHGGGEFSGSRGTWYRNIRWRPWPPIVPDRNFHGGKAQAMQRPAVRWDQARQGLHLIFPDAAGKRNLRVLTLDGKLMAEMRDVGGEAFLNTAGWERSVYLLRMDGKEIRAWASLILP